MANGTTQQPATQVWDGPVRLTHWAIALLFAAAWYTYRDNLQWHRYAGYALLTLVIFRIYWGFAGSSTARFSQFVKGPAQIAHYARALFRGTGSASLGHNPLGALSVLALIGLLLAQCVLGLFVTDVDGLESGPLSALVSFDTGRALSHWHSVLFTALKLVVALHIAAVGFYLVVKRDNLIRPMVTGHRHFDGDLQPLRFGAWWHAGIALAVSGAVVWLVARNG